VTNGKQMMRAGELRSPRKSRLPHTRLQAGGHFPLGFVDGGFEFRRESEPVLDKVIQPITNLLLMRGE
jgi:hypothetical protein